MHPGIHHGPRAAAAAALALLVLSAPAGAQQPADGGPKAEKDRRTVLVLDFQVLDRSVRPDESGELSEVAVSAARMFRDEISRDDRYRLVTMERFQDARKRLVAGEGNCADAACSREAARSVGVEHVFRGRVIKVSNLIWYLVVEHEDVETGRVLGQESIELKGQRQVILPRAIAALHRWLLPAG